MSKQKKIKIKNTNIKLSKAQQHISDMLEDDSTYFFVETSEDGSTYAYHMTTKHIRDVLANISENCWDSSYNVITKDELDEECCMDLYDAPNIHVVKVK